MPGWLVVGSLLLMYVHAYIDRQVITLLVEPIRASLQIDDFQISLLQGFAFSLFYALFGLLAGWLADHFPRRLILFAGVAVWSLATIACGLAQTFQQLMIARFLVGAGQAALVPIAYSTIAGLFPKERVALPIAVFSLGSSVGSGLSLIAGGAIIAAIAGSGGGVVATAGLEPWQIVFVAAGLPGIAIALLAFMLPPESALPYAAAARTGPKPPLAPYLRKRARYLACNIGALAASSTLAFCIGPWTPTFLIRTYGISIAEAGLLVGTCSALGGVAGFLVSGSAADWFFGRGDMNGHTRPLLIALPIAMSLAVLALWVAPGPLVSAICVGAIIGLTAMGNPIASQVQLSSPPALRARLAAITVMIQMTAGMTIGPSLVAAITQFGFGDPSMIRYSMLICAFLLGPLAIILLMMGRKLAYIAMTEADNSKS